MMRPFTIMAALCLLLGFRKLDIPHIKIINITASAVLGVYLLHENGFSKQFFWHTLLKFEQFRNSMYLIPYSIMAVFVVYALCTVIELARIKIFGVLAEIFEHKS